MFKQILSVLLLIINNNRPTLLLNGQQFPKFPAYDKLWSSFKGKDNSWMNEVVKPTKSTNSFLPLTTTTTTATTEKSPQATHLTTTMARKKNVTEINIDWTEPGNFIFNLTDPSVYNRLVAPGQLDASPTTVETGFYIESLSTFRVQTMDFEVDLYLLLAWTDPRLQHDHYYPILINDRLIAKRIWHPDIYFVNSKLAYIQEVTTPNFSIYVYSDGYVMTSIRISSTMACKLDLKKFPMDTQKCSIVLQSCKNLILTMTTEYQYKYALLDAFIRNVLNLTWHEGNGYPVMRNENLLINDMDIDDIDTGRCDDSLPLTRHTGHWSCIRASIKMKRKLEFHVFQSFFPLGMLVIISWLSFWIDYKVAPARVGLTITSLLTLTTISNANRLEFSNVPYMKANDLWAVVCQIFVFCVLLEYTLLNLVLNSVYSRSCPVHSKKATSLVQEVDPLLTSNNSKTCKICEKYLQRNAKNIDEVSKILFPSAFLLFVVLYTIYVIYT